MNIPGLWEREVPSPCVPQTLCDLHTTGKSVDLCVVKVIFLHWSAGWLELPRDTVHGHETAAISLFTRFQPLGSPHLTSAACCRSQLVRGHAEILGRWFWGKQQGVIWAGSGVIAVFSLCDERQQNW